MITNIPESVQHGDSFRLQTQDNVGTIEWSVQGDAATVDADGNVTVAGVEPFAVTATDAASSKRQTVSFTPQKATLTVSAATVTGRPYDRTTRVEVEDVTLQVSVRVTITKAVPEAPENLFTTYSHGAILSSVKLPEGWTWVKPNEVLGDVGQREFMAQHPGDGNYEPRKVTVFV